MDKYTKCSFPLFIFIGLLLFVSCEVDTSLDFPGPRPLPSGEQTVNGWIYNTMQINYLWNDEIPELEQIDETIDPKVFFMSF